jgi:hypothetical protein
MDLAVGEEHGPARRQLAACDVLLDHAEHLPDTLEAELHLYRERLQAALGAHAAARAPGARSADSS